MEFDHVGAHCSAQGCNVKDFLPFHCSGCKGTYCLSHRSSSSHNCTGSGNSRVVIVCPLCQTGIEQVLGEDPNVTFTRHEQHDCRRIREKKQKKAERVCPVSGCGKKLTSLNACKCSKCEQEFCLTHRYYEDHACRGVPKAAGWLGNFVGSASASSRASASAPQVAAGPGRTAAASGFLAALASRSGGATSTRKTAATSSARPSSSKAKPSAVPAGRGRKSASRDATAELRATAARRRQGGDGTPAATDAQAAAQAAGQSTSNAVPGREVCPHCGARYHSVLQLVEHVEQSHSTPQATSAEAATHLSEQCPHCSARFAGVAQLVAHVEAQHNSASRPVASSGASDCSVQ